MISPLPAGGDGAVASAATAPTGDRGPCPPGAGSPNFSERDVLNGERIGSARSTVVPRSSTGPTTPEAG